MNTTNPAGSRPAGITATAPVPVDARHRDALWFWHGDGFRIELRPRQHSRDSHPVQLSYRVLDDVWASLSGHDPLIFSGDDLVTTPGTDPRTAAEALSAVFGCEAAEIAEAYFASYSPAQRAWRDARAGDLSRWGAALSRCT